MLARAADWLRLYRIRLSVRLECFRWELSKRGIGLLSTGPGHHGRTPAGKTATRLGPAAAWLKPAFAVAAVVAVVVVGAVTLNRTQDGVITPANSVTSPGHRHARAGTTGVASPGQWQSGVNPSLPPAVSKAKSPLISPAVTCSPTPSPSNSPAPTASASASPTPSDSATATPSATPTGTSSPTATPTSGTASGTADGTTDARFTRDTGGGTPNISCGSTADTPTPKTTHTTS